MEPVSSIKTELEDFGVEFEVLLAEDIQLPQEFKTETDVIIHVSCYPLDYMKGINNRYRK